MKMIKTQILDEKQQQQQQQQQQQKMPKKHIKALSNILIMNSPHWLVM